MPSTSTKSRAILSDLHTIDQLWEQWWWGVKSARVYCAVRSEPDDKYAHMYTFFRDLDLVIANECGELCVIALKIK